MRVLLIHNRYRAEGGEERSVRDLATMLRARGHEVGLLERSSASASSVQAARGLVIGGLDPGEVSAAVLRLGADVVHAHNVHPLLGWRALAAARAAGARTVLHLHNYRLFCAVAVAFRDGRPCYECHGRRTLPGVVHSCRGSLGEAVAYAVGLARQQPRLFEHADAMVAVSEAAATRLVSLGAPAEKLTALANFVAAEVFAERSTADAGGYALAAGRLVPEKGFDTAIAAARAASVPLVIAGEGPAEGRLRALAAGADVKFTGHVPAARLSSLRAGAAVALVPSRWDEPLAYAALDALAAGVPVLASDRGGLPEAVGADAALPAGDAGAWARSLRELWDDPALRRERGEAGLALARERFGEDRYYDVLRRVYEA
jgi:glycosyltransferase involved in cell wall biosynthesis